MLITVLILILYDKFNFKLKETESQIKSEEEDINVNLAGVSHNGWLKTSGNKLQNEKGKDIQLQGISSHGIDWFYNVITKENLQELVDNLYKIKNDFFTEFPKVEKWITETGANAHITGYVEDVWGRRRRLPDILKEKYEISSKNTLQTFNPLLQSKGTYNCDYINNINEIKHKLSQCKFRKDVEEVKKFAESKNIKIKDNNGFIAQAERQCVNARIQGSAASMSKKAMIKVFNDERLKELGFKLLIAVHDELIGECPEENKEKVKEYLSEDMITCALPEVTVPMKCDVDDFPSWYFDVYSSEIKKEYDSNEKNFDKLCENHIEMTAEKLKEIIN